jgi:hypothetical protein
MLKLTAAGNLELAAPSEESTPLALIIDLGTARQSTLIVRYSVRSEEIYLDRRRPVWIR